MLKSLNIHKPYNFAAAERYDSINCAILHMEGEAGHEIAAMCLNDLKRNFSTKMWEQNGPLVITRVLYEICGTKDIRKMIYGDVCKNFRVLPIEMCYGIEWQELEKFFKAEDLKEVLNRLSGALIAHVWNSMSTKIPLSKNDNVAYIHLAKKYCPRTFVACEKF